MTRSITHILCLIVAACLFSEAASAAEPRLVLAFDSSLPQLRFAAAEIRRAAEARKLPCAEIPLDAVDKDTSSLRLILLSGTTPAAQWVQRLALAPLRHTGPQAYSIRTRRAGAQTTLLVLGADAPGTMYGGLDIAEAIHLNTLPDLKDSDHAPHIERRGIKFNIPLDARTPSYSDNSDAAQQNIPEMWSMDFWHEMLDEMARQRFNVLTLWNLHPFPSIVKVPEFPEVALADVKRITLPMDDTFSHSGSDMVRPAMLERLETVKSMSIDEKIRFWRDLMQYAQDRGIDVYWFTWNIFTFGAEGKYGITPAQSNPKTIEYFRASVRETVLTYPLLAGIGITAGEQMEGRNDEFSKEKWLWKTYGEGVRDALKTQPGRSFRLIHRYHQTGQGEILREWKDYPGPFDLSFKYAIAHMYSVPNPPFIQEVLPRLPAGTRTWLTVRNDDIYSFRWGDPQFARDFIGHIPGPDKIAGYYMGPDGYTWGRDFLSTDPQTPRQLVMTKQWFSFMLWGRLSYEPTLPQDLFLRTLEERFPEVPSDQLLAAWSAASKVFPQITRFFWGDIDLRWLPEACLSHPRHKGFYTVRHFIEGQPMPQSGILSIGEWRQRLLGQQEIKAITPLQVADTLEANAAEALRLLAALRLRQGQNKELRLTLGDLQAMAHLGHYYAEKIRGACDLALFDATREAPRKESAVRHLQAAAEHWKRYSAAYTSQYKQPVLYNRVGYVDMPALTTRVEADIRMAETWAPGTLKPAGGPRNADRPFNP